jgi:hypothetical protein
MSTFCYRKAFEENKKRQEASYSTKERKRKSLVAKFTEIHEARLGTIINGKKTT